ncbi:MAG: GNAT family N-acetyltransferase [Brevefilum sp.]
MDREEAKARLATMDDLNFVSQDGYIPQALIARKISQEECFIVELDNQPVGYLRLEYLWSSVPYIALIHVQKTYRKRGFSRVLLDFVTGMLRKSGHNILYSSSQADEPGPQSWHRHMGFKECGVIDGINQGGVGEIFFRLSF